MKPFLQPALLAPPPALEIGDAEYLELKRAKPILGAAFSFEENYDLLVGNYLEFENSALSITATSIARRRHDYQDLFELKADMNRRAVNFLSSARLFVDQLLQRVGECGGSKDEVKRMLSEEYDGCFEYRFMEALRNHVQHSGSAVHGLTIGGRWTPPGEKVRNEFSLGVMTLRRYLALDHSFKRQVLSECPDEVDLLGATRRYLESLSAIHEFTRQNVESSVNEARKSFAAAIKRYADFSGSSSKALTAFASSERDPSNQVAVFLDWDDVRIKLSNRNRNLKNLSKCVISSVAS